MALVAGKEKKFAPLQLMRIPVGETPGRILFDVSCKMLKMDEFCKN